MISLHLLVQVAVLSTTCFQPVEYRHASESLKTAIANLEAQSNTNDEILTNYPEIPDVVEQLASIKQELQVLHFPDNAGWLNAESRPMPDIGSHGIEQFIRTERKVILEYFSRLNNQQKQELMQEIERLKLRGNGQCRYLRLGNLEHPFEDIDTETIELVRKKVEENLASLKDQVSNKQTKLFKRLILSLRADVQKKLSQRLGFRASEFPDLLSVYSISSVHYTAGVLARSFDLKELPGVVNELNRLASSRIDFRFFEQSRWSSFYFLLMTHSYADLAGEPADRAGLDKLDRLMQPYAPGSSVRPTHVNTDLLAFFATRYEAWKLGRFEWTIHDRDHLLFPYDKRDVTDTVYHIDVIENYHEHHPPTTKKRATWTTAEFFSDEQKRRIRSIENKFKDLPILGLVDGPEAIDRLNQRNAELKDVLLPNQAVAYFQEFILEVGLGNYLLAPAVARELGLSDAEREQILNLLENGTAEIEAWETQQRQAILHQALTTDLAKLLPQLEQRLGLKLEEIIKFDPGATYDPNSYTEPKGFYRAYSYFYNDKGDYYPDLTYQHHRMPMKQNQRK